LALAPPAASLLLIACAEDASTAVPTEADGGRRDETSTAPDDRSAGGGEDDEDVNDPSTDSGKDAGHEKDGEGCSDVTLAVPILSGPHACGAIDFGRPPAPFTPVDADADSTMTGGTIPPGIYDVVGAERLSGNAGSWRETIVVGADGHFTRTRQIDTGSGTPGPVTYRSGTLTTSGSDLTFTEDCYVNGTDPGTPGTTTLPYEVVTGSCGESTLQYTATGFRFTLVARTTQ